MKAAALFPVLVVDDDESMRELTATWLEANGYQVRTAANGLDALRMLQSEMACALVVDLRMPIMDGIQFRHEQQLLPRIAGIPFILLSGEADLEQTGRDLDVNAVLHKPFDPRTLLSTVASHCRRF